MSRRPVEPLLALAITPKTRADSDKLTQALKTLTTEDPTLRVTANDASDEVAIAVMTELHLEIIVAGFMAFIDAARKAQPVLLEPVMGVEVVAQIEHISDVIASLLSRRARIQAQHDRGTTRIIDALVPLAEMFGYAGELRALTRGRASSSIHFDRYQQCTLSDSDDPGPGSAVGAPRKPRPPLRSSAIALPEPDPDDVAS